MKKNIFAVFLIFSACLLSAAKKKAPEWIIFPSSVYPSDVYMNGTGSGETREIAELEAVRNLSSVFGQTVHSANTASKKMEQALSDGKVAFSSDSSLQQNITSQIEAENLIGIEIAEYFYNSPEKKWYAIAILHKQKTAVIYENLILKNDESLRRAVAESEKVPGTFYGYSEICFALDIAKENDRLLKNLSVIDFDKGTEIGNQIVSLKTVEAAQKQFAEGITIYVSLTGDVDNRIKSAFQDIFSKYGFKTSSSRKEKYSLEGRYTSEFSKKGKVTYCIYILTMDFADRLEEKSLFAINLKGREGGTSENDAKNRTYRVLEKKISTEFSKNFDTYMNSLSFQPED
ncbi:LPP20 family lipoprotein [Treponema berlinense]|uniref:LPP20 family lipoprotein n=1 Tax=Treponema berlinense TaxID=225004 RepID=UPI0026ED0486|nr:LPP20 family lipoprotein [Treponema berlinense]